MTKLGDTHNFGKYVTIENSEFVIKPRNVFWEFFFFGLESPILKLLEKQNKRFDKLKKINILKNDIHHSKVRFIYEDKAKVSDSDLNNILTNFMDLSAYSIFFGMMDLNIENIFHLDNHEFIAIDNELVLNDIPSISATGLLPNRSMLYRKTGISKIFTSNYQIADNLILNSLQRFNETFSILLKNTEEIYHTLKQYEEMIAQYPNRIIVRNTSEYMEYLQNKNVDHSFYPEELVQLKRGDVPYFFYLYSEKSFKYYLNEKMESTYISDSFLNFYFQNVVSSLPNFEYLKDKYSLSLKNVYSMLEIFELLSIISEKNNLYFHTEDLTLELNEELATISKLNFGTYSLARKYDDESGVIELDSRINELRGETMTKASRQICAFIRLD